MRLMHQAVEDRIGQRRVADRGMPMLDLQLAGDDGRAGAMAVIEDLQEVPAAFVGQRRQRPFVDHQHLGLGQLRQRLGVTAIAAADGQRRQEARQAHIEHRMPLPTRLIGQGAGKKVLPIAVGPQISTFWWSPPSARSSSGRTGPVEAARMPEIDILRRRRLFQPARFRRAVFCRDSRSAASLSTSRPEALLERQLADVGVWAWLAKALAMPEGAVGGVGRRSDDSAWVFPFSGSNAGPRTLACSRGNGLGRGRHALDVQAILQDRFQAAVGRRADGDGPLAGRFQTVVPVGLAQSAGCPGNCPVALLRMAALMQDALHDGFGMRPDTPGPVEQPRRIPALNRLMGRGHVRIDRRVPAAKGRCAHGWRCGSRDETARPSSPSARLSTFCRAKAVGHRVVMAVELDVIVDADPRRPSIRRTRNAFPARAVTPAGPFGEGRFPAARQFLEGPAIQRQHQFGDVPIELTEAEESLMRRRARTQRSTRSTGLDLGLVFRAIRPGGQDGGGVMDGQVTIGRVEFGVVDSRRLLTPLFRLSGTSRAGTPPKNSKARHGCRPVRQRLAPGGFAVGVIRGAENGDEDGGLPNFAGQRVGDRHGRAGVIDKQFLAGACVWRRLTDKPASPGPVMVAEAAVLIAVRVLALCTPARAGRASRLSGAVPDARRPSQAQVARLDGADGG
jgi:hypothetical protein